MTTPVDVDLGLSLYRTQDDIMLKLIAESPAELLDFINGLDTPLSAPQKRHVVQIADALITTEGRKDLSNLYHHIVGNPRPICRPICNRSW